MKNFNKLPGLIALCLFVALKPINAKAEDYKRIVIKYKEDGKNV